MNISVIIPSFEGAELLKKNLPKVLNELKSYKEGKTEVIVVDDGSTDNTEEVLEKFPEVKLMVNSKNSGFSTTVNKGASKASGDILILLNTDVYPEPGFLKPLLEHFKEDFVFAVGCMDKSVEHGKIVLRGRGLGKWQRGFLVHWRGEIDKDNTLWVSGGSGAFRKSIWDKLNGLNELYSPFYWEDIDLSYRARKAAYKVVFENKSVVTHEHEKGAIKKKFSPFKVKTTAYRNQFIFVWTNLTDGNLLLSHFLWLPYHLVKAALALDMAFYLGFINALIRLSKILQKRSFNKKICVLSDISATTL